MVKLLVKAQKIKNLAHHKYLSSIKQNSEIEKQKPLFFIKYSWKIENLFVYLIILLKS